MASTLRIVIDEIRTTIKQTFDDKSVSRAQVAYWVIVVGNKLLSQHNIKRSSGAFLVPFAGIPIETVDDNSQRYLIKGRKFIRLPGDIFDFDRDGGVGFVAYYDPNETKPEFQRKTAFRTTQNELQWMELNDLAKPSVKTPYWYRVGNIIYIVGIENVPVTQAEVGLYLTIDPLETIDIDQPFFFPAELLEILKRQVTDLAKFSFLFPQDRKNDGEDTATVPATQQIPKITSVNDTQQ
jgi:hypothetical protein